MTDQEITLQAIEFAKKNKLRIARELTDPNKYKPTAHPVSVFMAGSPGAGKTEFSKNLAKDLHRGSGQNFILDGTFSNYRKATENINRSLAKDRIVSVFYLYQKPEIAWKFTQAREKAEGRNIPKTAFINQFFCARETIEKLIMNYGGLVKLTLVAKDFENKTMNLVEVTDSTTKIDGVTFPGYNKRGLEGLLK